MIRQSRKIQFILLLTLVCLVGAMTIAYAILSTTLNITGNTEVIASSWNVHFANIQTNPMSVTPTKSPTIIDSKTIDFSVVLNKPGDFYKFNVDIVNDGSINAMIDNIIKNPTLTDEQAKYIKYEIEYINGENISTKQLLASGETKTISVLLSYRTDITATDLPTSPTTLNLSIQLNYVQADTSSTEITSSPKKINIKSGDLNTVGSEICIGQECFYLIENNAISITMLSKYNLLVGNTISNASCTSTPLENPTGKQDITAHASFWNINTEGISFPWIGTIEFSEETYWLDKIKKFPTYVYNSQSKIYNYINDYRMYLEKNNLVINEARLISYEELEKLGCNKTEWQCNKAPSWVYSTTYWTGSAFDATDVYDVLSNGMLGSADYNSSCIGGIRPVIEVPLTEF